jgi:hypothetical protein
MKMAVIMAAIFVGGLSQMTLSHLRVGLHVPVRTSIVRFILTGLFFVKKKQVGNSSHRFRMFEC